MDLRGICVTYRVTRIDTTSDGHLYVEVDFGDGHLNDFIFPDTDDPDVIRRVIRDWRTAHPGRTNDERSSHIVLTGECRVPELMNCEL